MSIQECPLMAQTYSCQHSTSVMCKDLLPWAIALTVRVPMQTHQQPWSGNRCTNVPEATSCSHLRSKVWCPQPKLQFCPFLHLFFSSGLCPPAPQLLYSDSPLSSLFRQMTRSGVPSSPRGYFLKEVAPSWVIAFIPVCHSLWGLVPHPWAQCRALSSLVSHLSEIKLHVPSSKPWQVLVSLWQKSIKMRK